MCAAPSYAAVPGPSPRVPGGFVRAIVAMACVGTALGCGHDERSTLPRADEVYVEGPVAADGGAATATATATTAPNPVAAFYRSSAMLAVGAPVPDGVGSADAIAEASNDPTDLEITRRVRAAIAADALLSDRALGADVTTREGTVILRGHAASDGERARVEQHARATRGVRDVVNVIAVDR